MTTSPARDRAEIGARARHAFAHIEEPTAPARATLGQLGAARDQLNIAQNVHHPAAVREAVYALETIVLAVHQGRPADCPTCHQ